MCPTDPKGHGMTNLYFKITCMKRTDLKILLLQFDLEKILNNH